MKSNWKLPAYELVSDMKYHLWVNKKDMVCLHIHIFKLEQIIVENLLLKYIYFFPDDDCLYDVKSANFFYRVLQITVQINF